MVKCLCVAVMLVVLACRVAPAGRPSRFSLLAPPDGAKLDTPLTAVLQWEASDGAECYRVTVRRSGSSKLVVDEKRVSGTELRTSLLPDTDYTWSVEALSADGSTRAENAPSHFRTAGTAAEDVTDAGLMFAGVHPGSHWQQMEQIPDDPKAAISPWFDRKKLDMPPPPTFDQVRAKLPTPVFDGHEDLIGMYWFAWKTYFSVWLFAPPSNENMAVSNVIGIRNWGDWGSTMVWDTAFILQFARYGDAAYPSVTGLDNCYARQHENGFICRESDSNNREVFVVYPVNPPLLAWAEWRYYEATGDKERLKLVLLPLVKNYEWYMRYQRRANGLYWTQGFNEADDSPRNDLAHDYVSTTSIQAMSASTLAKMAKIAGRSDLAKWFAAEAKSLGKAVNASFWDAEHGIYNDLGADGRAITETPRGICKHAHMFWPLVAGIATSERANLCAKELENPATFNRASGTASLSADSWGYNAANGAYWRGAVWPPTQYMVIKGLDACGLEEQAGRLAEKYVNASLKAYRARGDITEYLAPDRPEANGVGSFAGWGGLAPIAILFEDILGIRLDAPSNTIAWRLRRTERHGVENLRFAGRTVSLVCEARNSPEDPCRITVESDGAFKLTVDVNGKKVERRIPKGRTEFVLGE